MLYSCPGFILLGKILEKVDGKRLDTAFLEQVAAPLQRKESGFLPAERERIVNSNRSEDEISLINDYDCRFLGGVAGNAGLFYSLCDVRTYVTMLQNRGDNLFGAELFARAVQNWTPGMSASRGLGFQYVDDGSPQTGNLFREGNVGHCGHTGQSVFVDERSGLYAILLTDATICTVRKYGTERYAEVMRMRGEIHRAVKEDLGL